MKIQEVYEVGKKLGLFESIYDNDLNEIKLPFILKEVKLCTEGVWNGVKFTKKNISASFKNTFFNKETSSLFLDHKEDANSWIGEVANIKLSKEGKLIGDLIVVDRNIAAKLAYGAHYGISPAIQVIENKMSNNVEEPKLFEFLNFSVVFRPAIEDAMLVNKNDVVKEDYKMSKKKNNDKDTKEEVKLKKELPKNDKKPAEAEDKKLEKYDCECVKCGYKMKSDKHCKDLKCPECGGQMRSEERPGSGQEKSEMAGLVSYECSKCGHKIEAKEDSIELKCPKCGEEMKKVEDQEFVKKEDFVKIVKGFEKLKKDYDSVVKKFSEDTKELNDSKVIIKQKDKMIASYAEKVKQAENKIAKFEQEKVNAIKAKKEARFNDIFNKYCKFYKIPNSDRQKTKKELGTLSETALETIGRDIGRAMESFVAETETTQNSEQLIATSDKGVFEQNNNLSPEDKTDALFSKIRQAND